jgi:antitoxin component of RelBE/YafQ-DinJ toxin-antitoxin module
MRTEYDFARMKGRKNPYARRLKRSVTIRLDDATIAYFKELAAETGVAYQSLINLYLRDCVVHRRRPVQRWVSRGPVQPEKDAGGGILVEDEQADSETTSADFVASDKPARSQRCR